MAFLCRVFLFRPCRLVFVESFCRVETLSVTGWMLLAIADEFVVQWPQLDRRTTQEEPGETESRFAWRGVRYIGRLC